MILDRGVAIRWPFVAAATVLGCIVIGWVRIGRAIRESWW